jgi:hypothetical protein
LALSRDRNSCAPLSQQYWLEMVKNGARHAPEIAPAGELRAAVASLVPKKKEPLRERL